MMNKCQKCGLPMTYDVMVCCDEYGRPAWKTCTHQVDKEDCLARQIDQAQQKFREFKQRWIKSNDEIEQTLGKALHYPRFANDPKNFPDCDADDPRVFIGLDVAETLAEKAAQRIEQLEAVDE